MSAFLERQAELQTRVIHARSAVAPSLLSALDSAAISGTPLPSLYEMYPHITWSEDPAYQPTPGFDGTLDGEIVEFAEEMRWCTLREHYGWGFPCRETVDAIANIAANQTIIDFGAGTGYWTAVLRNAGLTVIPADNQSWRMTTKWIDSYDYHDGFAAIQENPGAAVLISWPDPSLPAQRLTDHFKPGQFLMRCGPYHVTGEPFSAACHTWFDEIITVPVASSTASPESLELKILAKRATPKPGPAPETSNPFKTALRKFIPA